MPTDDDVREDIRQIRNDLDRVRQDIDSINRVQVISNSAAILADIKRIVGKSKLMVAALFLTKEWIGSRELAGQLRIDQANLDKVVNNLVENGLLYREKRGKAVYYKRAARFDLIGFEGRSEFTSILGVWKDSLE
jgi:DNA-binding MarR family transcriptional regulator